jgi:rod shape determining protein RodA
MPVDRRLLVNVDWVMLAVVLILAAIGVATIRSATHNGANSGLYLKQLVLVGLGVAGLIAALAIDYRRLADRAPLLYVAAVVALSYVLRFGPTIASTRRWLVVGGIQIQPSELAKLVAAIVVAKVFAESRKESLGLVDIAGPGLAVGVLALLIAAEPDLGTAFCLVPLFLTVAFLAGLRMRAVLAVVVGLAVAAALWWQFVAQPYQKDRVYNFLEPGRDLKKAGYQRNQSQIAVGSGGLTGKGYKNGSQSQLGYLPARHTDFIFSVLAEEMGFAGVVVVLGLYLLVLWRALETAQLARDRVGAFLAAGIASVLAFQVVYNVAMVAGLVPVKGLPLPLMSYGGASILSTFLGIGLIINVRMRRFAN